MPWFKVDDSMWSHPKFLGLSDKAFRLWVRAGAYACQHLTDGVISDDMLGLLGAARKHCDELWAAGLWERVPEGGYRFHDWQDYQPSSEQVRSRRDEARERMARLRAAKKEKALREHDEPPEESW